MTFWTAWLLSFSTYWIVTTWPQMMPTSKWRLATLPGLLVSPWLIKIQSFTLFSILISYFYFVRWVFTLVQVAKRFSRNTWRTCWTTKRNGNIFKDSNDWWPKLSTFSPLTLQDVLNMGLPNWSSNSSHFHLIIDTVDPFCFEWMYITHERREIFQYFSNFAPYTLYWNSLVPLYLAYFMLSLRGK